MSAVFTLGRNRITREPINIKMVEGINKHDFVCPECNGQLTCVLNVPDGTRHFKHRSEGCNATFETLLHLTAKEILVEHSAIKLPNGAYFEYQEALPEKNWNKYRPDVTLSNGFRTLYVEIIVSNPISLKKELFFSERTAECLIIDLSDYSREFDIQQLRYDVLESLQFRRMLHDERKYDRAGSETYDAGVTFLLGSVILGLAYIGYKQFIEPLFNNRIKRQ